MKKAPEVATATSSLSSSTVGKKLELKAEAVVEADIGRRGSEDEAVVGVSVVVVAVVSTVPFFEELPLLSSFIPKSSCCSCCPFGYCCCCSRSSLGWCWSWSLWWWSDSEKELELETQESVSFCWQAWKNCLFFNVGFRFERVGGFIFDIEFKYVLIYRSVLGIVTFLSCHSCWFCVSANFW